MTAITASLTDATANVLSAETCHFKIATPDTLWNTTYMNAALDQLRR
jgi:hypothetical protein